MKALFWRVLALLLVSFLVVLLGSYGLFHWIGNELNPRDQRIQSIAQQTANRLIDGMQAGELERVRARLQRRNHIRSWIIDESGQPVTSQALPEEIARQIAAYPEIIHPGQNPVGRFFIITEQIERDNHQYKVILAVSPRSFNKHRRGSFFWLPLVAMLLGLLAASALLSHWVLRPLRTFHRTARAITGDTMDARIPASVTGRSDAFGELGREFNRMTDRVEKSVENQNQLLRDVSHELRSPLARIQVAASLWGQKFSGAEYQSRIEDEVARLDNLIGDLLSLSRLKSGITLSRSTVNFNALVNNIVDDANFEFAGSAKQVVADLDDTQAISCDPALLSSALENIIRNALRHSPDQGVVSITGNCVGKMLRIVISDQGPGVSEEQLENIFEPFYRIDDARTTGNDHHGIGLALARAVVALHGGTISASNGVRGGLDVAIELPLPG